MPPTSPARDSHSLPAPISSNTSPSLPYSSRPQRTPNSRGIPSVDPSSATVSSFSRPSSPTSTCHQPPQQQQAEASTSQIPSSPSLSASPQRRPFETTEDHEMHSPSSSSQGDAADTEMESGPPTVQPLGQDQSLDPPPKKKRTRTLTTPHQSAVLHALLAQVCAHQLTYSNYHPFLIDTFISRVFPLQL